MTKKQLPALSLRIIGYVLLAALLLAVGFFIGSGWEARSYQNFLSSLHLVRQNDPSTPFVHPIVGFSSSDALSVNQFVSLSNKIKASFSANGTDVDRYSVYFRDLNSGLWFGINENAQYDPGSMLKVALAMSAYKEAETDPSFLTTNETYTPALAAIDQSQQFADPSELVVGQSYTIEDLIQKMLVDSDNGAKDILGNTVDQQIQDEAYTSISLTVPSETGEYQISPKQYAQFFRTLYGGTFLNDTDSNTLLSLMSHDTFTKALASGIPAGTTISHKWGEHVVSTDNSVNALELSDCGVIYDQKHPYLLCVMTQGKDEDDLATAIASSSAVVYQETEGDYK